METKKRGRTPLKSPFFLVITIYRILSASFHTNNKLKPTFACLFYFDKDQLPIKGKSGFRIAMP
jgi:hypothetical protein